VFEEIARVLVPGGIAIVTIPKRRSWNKVIDVAFTPLRNVIRWRPRGRGLQLNRKEAFERLYLTPQELDAAALRAGLRKRAHRHYNVRIACGPLIGLSPRFAYLLNRPFEFLALLPGSCFFATGYIGMYVREP
jgi:hypothetical protein